MGTSHDYSQQAMNTKLTKIERLVLAVLEEAGEDDISALLNTIVRYEPADIATVAKALRRLIESDLLRIEKAGDASSPPRKTLPRDESIDMTRELESLIQWSATDRLWVWPRSLPRAGVALTDGGLSAARQVLREDGWPQEIAQSDKH